ncbi:MAG: YedE-related selenium metabolism membrane protein [Nitrospira sp.]|nr:YedE-related selenium metabolism membrane protein [Nitrospira sp.]
MSYLKSFFGTRWGIILVGAFIGVFAALLQKWGNPPNMGVCVACFERDIAGALGLHRVDVVQYIRSEVIGFVFGSLISAYIFKEFRPRVGSAPIVRFILGFFAMIGALVFLGCPWRVLLRLAGGDGNAILGLSGLVVGVAVGVLFLKKGYSLGRNQRTFTSVGWLLPLIMASLLAFLIIAPLMGDGGKSGPIFFSEKGPGSMHAPLVISLIIGLAVGFLAQRSRFCTMGAIRDIILVRNFHLASGVFALLFAAFVTNIILGQFKAGFEGQPIAHNNHIWNFLGMSLAGLSFALAGGCPGRQLFMAGEGDGDAAMFVIGMITGAGFSHNFSLASSPAGPGLYGPTAVIIGLLVCLFIGFTMREKVE